MKASVRDGFVAFTTPLEGCLPFMYLDVRGLVTTGIGNLIDPVAYALHLPFLRDDGTPATASEIEAEWRLVKSRSDLKMHGGKAYAILTQLRLSDEGIEALVARKLAQNDQHIAARFSEWESWPADAQMAVHSMAWACGPGFHFPMLEAAIKAQNFTMASLECTINETGNPGLKPRNAANRVLFKNAARVLEDNLDPEVLYWPEDLAKRSDPDVEETVIHDRNALYEAMAAMRDKEKDP